MLKFFFNCPFVWRHHPDARKGVTWLGMSHFFAGCRTSQTVWIFEYLWLYKLGNWWPIRHKLSSLFINSACPQRICLSCKLSSSYRLIKDAVSKKIAEHVKMESAYQAWCNQPKFSLKYLSKNTRTNKWKLDQNLEGIHNRGPVVLN